MAELSLSAMNRINKKTGAERVSEDANEELRRVLEQKGQEIAKRAIRLANHAGRKTVKAEDIKLATEG